MLIKFLLKIWPALMPFLLYSLWVLAVRIIANRKRKKGFIEANYKIVGDDKIGDFSLKNSHFVMVVYISLILMVISFLFFAIKTPRIEDGNYIPAESKDGKIIPSRIVR
jgi:hypothetical protein